MKQFSIADFYRPTRRMLQLQKELQHCKSIGDGNSEREIFEEMASLVGIYYTSEKKKVNGVIVNVPKVEFYEREFINYIFESFTVISIGENVAFRNYTEHHYQFVSATFYLFAFKSILDDYDETIWNSKREKEYAVRFLREIENRYDTWQIPKDKIVFSNGVYDVSTNTFTAGDDISILNFHCTGYAYDPTAQCPRFKQAMWSAFEDNDVIKVIQEAIFGNSFLYGSNPRQLIGLLIGSGRNFKSCMASVLVALHGIDATGSASLEQLNQRFGPALIYDRVVSVSSENPSDVSISTSLIKAISGNDIITIDQKFEKPFQTRIYCKLVILTNEITFAPERSAALGMRLVCIPFPFTFTDNPTKPGEKQIIYNLEEQLLEELPGIAIWALQGLQNFKARGYKIPYSTKVEQLKHDILKDSNPVLQFFDACVKQVVDAKSKKAVVYASFQEWCRNNGVNPRDIVSANRFYKHFDSILESNNISSVTKRIQGNDYYSDIKVTI